jgi:membrane protein DedA with SNARE-associated domain
MHRPPLQQDLFWSVAVPNYGALIWHLVLRFLTFATAGWGGFIPEEVLVVEAGIWTARHSEFSPFHWLMLPVVWVGVVFSDALLYGAGRFYGTRLLEYRFFAKMMPAAKRQKVEHNFQKYGIIILLFGRLVPGIRLPLFMTAGMMRLSVTHFLISDFLGAILGNSVLFFLAYWFGTQFQELFDRIEANVSAAKPIIILCLITAAGAYLLYHFIRRPFETGDPAELPIIGPQIAAHLPTKSGVTLPPVATPDGEPSKDGQVQSAPAPAKAEQKPVSG